MEFPPILFYMIILIADDSALIRSNLGKLITQKIEDINLKNSSDVKNTLRNLYSLPVDVLILDIQFPDGSGLDVLRYLKNHPDRPFIIVLTNNSRQKIREQSLHLGADLFFDKTEEYEKVVEEIVRLNNR
ncbi:MAG: response regulator [Spirochaetia bacterium]|nr:response regulator [Spirochaetia bacterium]